MELFRLLLKSLNINLTIHNILDFRTHMVHGRCYWTPSSHAFVDTPHSVRTFFVKLDLYNLVVVESD